MDKVLQFFNQVVFNIGNFAVKTWYIIVAAVVLLAVIVIVAIVISKKIKAKARQDAWGRNVKKDTDDEYEYQSAEQVAFSQPKTTEEIPVVEEIKEEVVVIGEEQPKTENIEKVEVQEKPTVTKEKSIVKKTAEKKPAVKKEVEKEVAKKPTKRLNGKWKIVHKNDKEYIAELLASNGEVMLSSEIYSTAEGAKNGIATIIKGVENGNFLIYRDKGGDYYYKLKSASNKLLCVGEIYKTKDGCVSAVESVKRIASNSPIVDQIVKGEEYIEYTPEKAIYNLAKSAKGKWKIEKVENGYSAKLYANNGQLMIATEVVAQKATAEKAVLSVKKNSAEGNFIIDKDKFGRFYYKLRNAQKSVICIGETYDSLDLCIKALESVRKFADISEIVK